MERIEASIAEQLYPIHFTRLNRFSYLASHNKFVIPSVFEFAPPKIRNRLKLTDHGWCRLGTVFVPPGEILTLTEIKKIHKLINRTNPTAGRPEDPEVIIRTAGVGVNWWRWQSQSYLVKPNGKDEVMARDLSKPNVLPFDAAMKLIRGNWKIIHGENKEEQEKTVHGKLHVSSSDLSLELATGVVHARSLDRCRMTAIPLTTSNGIDFIPTNLRIIGQPTEKEAADFIRDCHPLGKLLGEFVDWASINLGLPDYVVDIRYYTQGCKPDESFHVLDIDSQYQ